jgi:SPP1 gp7 family putative phage head morphogenesis protein
MSFIDFAKRVKALEKGRKKRSLRKTRFPKRIYNTLKQEKEAYELIYSLMISSSESMIEEALKSYKIVDDLEELEKTPSVSSVELSDFDLNTDKLISNVERSVSNSFAEFSKISIGERYIPDPVEKTLLNNWKNNFIIQCKSATDDLKKIISKDVYDSVMRGDALSVVRKKILESTNDYTKKKAQFIARDQVSKLNGSINKIQQKSVGINLYVWNAVGDARTRDSHSKLNGVICSWDDPTIYYKVEGNTLVKHKRLANMFIGNPSDDYQCRCFGLPFIPELEGIDG